ncbi:MAG: S8 family serine peptidase [Candidatus Sumerlaeia bacterium]|nr:S8 family serine peptidase [Candidatus Sumerlaeia bacterium]
MSRNGLRTGLRLAAVLAAAATLIHAIPAPAAGDTALTAFDLRNGEGGTTRLEQNPGLTALVYDPALREHEVLARASADAEALGFELVKTMAAGRMALLKGPRESVAASLSAREGTLPVAALRGVWMADGIDEPRRLVVPTGGVLLRFRPEVPQSRRDEFLSQQGLAPIFETSMGVVVAAFPDSTPEPEILARAEGFAAAHPDLLETSCVDLAKSGTPHGRPSAAAPGDEFYPTQYYHNADGRNAFFSSQDGDLDTSRLWQTRGYGDEPNDNFVIVGVFDSGTDLDHEDLQPSLFTTPLGVDFVDGDSLPNMTTSLFGAHGTAMAGIIGAARNNVGLIGVAPGAKVITYRIFAADFSTTTARVVGSLNDATTRGVTLGNHSYGIDADQEGERDLAYRLAAEAGRGNLGMLNLASGGDTGYPRLDFPASSAYTVGVVSVNEFGQRVLTSNYTSIKQSNVVAAPGLPFDSSTASAPTMIDSAGNLRSQSTAPFAFPDIEGRTQGASSELGGLDADGNYSAIQAQDDTEVRLYRGTSFSTALVTGVAAQMLRDPRYAVLDGIRPGITPDTATTVTTVSQALARTTDGAGPGGFFKGLNFINDYNLFFGSGRVNAMNPMYPAGDTFSEDTVQFRPDGVRSTDLVDVPNGTWEFGAQQPDYRAEELGEPWTPYTVTVSGELARVDIPAIEIYRPGEDEISGTQQVLGPAWEPVKSFTIWDVVDGELTEIDSFSAEEVPLGEGEEADLWDERGFLYLWADSRATTNTQPGDEVLVYNPEGRYLADTTTVGASDFTPTNLPTFTPPGAQERFVGLGDDIPGNAFTSHQQVLVSPTLQAPPAPASAFAIPIWAQIDVGFELGTQNTSLITSRNADFSDLGEAIPQLDEFDTLRFELLGAGASFPVVFTGDTDRDGEAKQVVKGATVSLAVLDDAAIFDDERRFAFWSDDSEDQSGYRPIRGQSDIIIRRFNVFLGFVPPGAPFNVSMTFTPNSSYLPTYELEIPEDDSTPPAGPREGLIPHLGAAEDQPATLIQRHRFDYQGYQFAGLKLRTLPNRQALYDFFFPLTHRLASSGSRPNWTLSTGELLYSSASASRGGTFLDTISSAPVLPTRRIAPFGSGASAQANTTRRPLLELATGSSAVTGLRAHPFLSLLATTREDGTLTFSDDDAFGSVPFASASFTSASDPSFSLDGLTMALVADGGIWALYSETFDTFPTAFPANVLNSTNMPFLDRYESPVFDDTGTTIVFTAARGESQVDLYAVNAVTGRIYPPHPTNFPFPLLPFANPILLGADSTPEGFSFWALSDERDAFLAAGGELLFFVSNRVSPVDASLSANYQIYVITNLRGVIERGERAQIAHLPPALLALPAGTSYTSFRFPTLDASNTILSFVANPDANGVGDVVWTFLPALPDPVDVDPTPTPNTTPTPVRTPEPTPTPRPDDQVSLVGEFSFGAPTGWQFGTAAPELNPALGSTTGGALNITSNDTAGELNCFGFFTSPAKAFAPNSSDRYYLYRTYLRANASALDKTPTIRSRINSGDFQLAYTSEINSLGNFSEVPGSSDADRRAIDIVFKAPADFFTGVIEQERNFRLSIDLLNFLQDDDRFGSISLDRVEIYALGADTLSPVSTIYQSELNGASDQNGWVFGNAEPVIDTMIGTADSSGLRIAATANDNNFGFWSTQAGFVVGPSFSEFPAVVRLTARIRSANTGSPLLNPDIRLRVNTEDFSRNSVAVISSTGNGAMQPVGSEVLELSTYLVLRAQPSTPNFILSFDGLAFDRSSVTPQPIILDSVTFEEVRIAGYPALTP